MKFDLIVIGIGLSGLIAAKTAVEMGKKVLIIGKGMGTVCLFSNTIDLLGSIPPSVSVFDGICQWIKEYPHHPYGKIDSEIIKESLRAFNSVFPSNYTFRNEDDRNCLIPTPLGTFKPTYLIPPTMVSWNGGKEESLIIGFRGLKDFYADLISRRIGCNGITLSYPELISNEVTQTQMARLFEKRDFREIVAKEIKKYLKKERYIGLPAVLGIDFPSDVKNDLERLIGIKIFEIPTLPPSIPGLRIFNYFKQWLIQKGATLLYGYKVTNSILKGKICEGIEVYNPPNKSLYMADRYILATGRFIGGGLQAQSNFISESLFNLPVSFTRFQKDWFDSSFFGRHPIHKAGITVNSNFQPISEKGEIIVENLWVCGTILSEHNYFDEKSKEGIEISTGYMAAKKAFEV